MAPLGAENKQLTRADWQEIDTVLLDLDGTLLDLNFDLHFWMEYLPLVYSEKHNISHQEAKDTIMPMLNAEMGKLNWYCLDYWQDALEMDIVQLKQSISHLIQVLPHVEDFLNQARANNKKIILATNAHRKTIKLKMAMVNLESHFDDIISSHDYGVAKQEQGFWMQLADELKLNKERAIFFDDSLDVLKSAKEFNIKHIVAISKPSSKREAKTVPGFINIVDFSEVLPIGDN
ncbi:MAG: GMP/IMP nucleotidase [Gammaproteobacteria bacterium]|nr:GMP/IMP nucleotidase [Gammaproteobacteria bacterium]